MTWSMRLFEPVGPDKHEAAVRTVEVATNEPDFLECHEFFHNRFMSTVRLKKLRGQRQDFLIPKSVYGFVGKMFRKKKLPEIQFPLIGGGHSVSKMVANQRHGL